MKRSQLKNKENKTKDPKDIFKAFQILDSKPFWKSCKPYFSNKHSFGGSKTALNDNGEILTENMKITNF